MNKNLNNTYTLYFKSKCHNERFIAECNTKREVFIEIKDYLSKQGFISYYQNIYYVPDIDRTVIDFGSHVEFFEVTGNLLEKI